MTANAQTPALQEVSWTIEPQAVSVGDARRRAVAAVADWCPGDLPAEYADTIRRVVSELVTNAIRHAGQAGPITIAVWVTPNNNLAIVVHDSSPNPPQQREPYDDGRSGHGLTVVAAETITWNWRPEGKGKSVCATVALPHSLTRPRRAAALAARVRDAIPRPPVHSITPCQAAALSAA
ncbi:anti-sigma regulatory factor (Ser/Thr protein kinase) [Kitasatospora sp. MAA4]|uniref:ATP-binding protein n=1 Tax=Kitasatospora sp. MAA4 TaxID=3035093 RepID=UPI002473420F|nr:ATP-binding protein [Kitasatospora sp. MAA4]MDH6134272.1 anti-sigma regulatory factor (Ser/Thr protein kinase) [Kitasatospora sp. MAA4]